MSVTLEEEVIPGLLPDGTPDPTYAASLGLVSATPARRSAAFAIDYAVFVVLWLPIAFGTIPLMAGIIADRPYPADLVRWSTHHPDFLLALILYIVSSGLMIIFAIVQLSLHGMKGVTLGKAAVGIRSVNVATFANPGLGRIVLRALVFGASFVVIPVLGAVPFLLSPLWDPRKRGRGWLDLIGKNWLVDIRRGIDPYDVKAMRQARRALTAPELVQEQALPSLATGTAWAGPTFVPAARSSSGVVSHAPVDEGIQQWEVPVVGTPSPAVAPPAPAAPVASAPAAPIAQAAQPSTPQALLVFDNGLTLAVRGAGLLGRAPEPQPGEAVEHLYSVDDPARQLSKTHLAFGIDAHGVWVIDRGSSNGTYVSIGSGAAFALEPGKPYRVNPGAIVEIGDRTFTVRGVS